MTTQAFVGNIFLARGDGGSPEAYTRVCQVFGISGVGQTNEQIEATTFCSGGIKEYIAGLADGQECTLELNFETAAQAIKDMIADVKAKRVRSLRLECDGNGDGVVDLYISYQATCLSWVLNPSPNAKNTINFGFKISGDVVGTDVNGAVVF